jgi:hypothetical protein
LDQSTNGARCVAVISLVFLYVRLRLSHSPCLPVFAKAIYTGYILGHRRGRSVIAMLGVKKYYGLRGDNLSYAISFIAGLDFL